MNTKDQRGITLLEIVICMVVVGLTTAATAAVAIPWIAREKMRSAVYDVTTHMQLARVEAVTRNRNTRLIVDPTNRSLEIRDSMGTMDDTGDDQLVHSLVLPQGISFNRPDEGDAITLKKVDGTELYEVVFSPDGVVAEGAGGLALAGESNEDFEMVMVYGAGGVQIDRWDSKKDTWLKGDEHPKYASDRPNNGGTNGNGRDGTGKPDDGDPNVDDDGTTADGGQTPDPSGQY